MANILIVEDESITAMHLKFLVNKMGHNVIGMVDTGENAIEKALKEKPDLILMDIYLIGKMNGIEAIKEIQKETYIPVIYVTAYSECEMLKNAKETKMAAYITKPIVKEHLIETIKKTLEENKIKS